MADGAISGRPQVEEAADQEWRGFGASALIAVDVATAVMRRGVPVIVSAEPEDVTLVLALEAASARAAELLSDLCGRRPRLIWSGRRSRLGDRFAADVRDELEVESGLLFPTAGIHLLADEDPGGGSGPLTRSDEAALGLAKLAGLLPAILSAPLPVAVQAAGNVAAWAAQRHLAFAPLLLRTTRMRRQRASARSVRR